MIKSLIVEILYCIVCLKLGFDFANFCRKKYESPDNRHPDEKYLDGGKHD